MIRPATSPAGRAQPGERVIVYPSERIDIGPRVEAR